MFENREDPTLALNQKMTKVLVAMGERDKGGKQEGRGRGKGKPGGRPSLGRNQCAYCKEEGHWKNECPKRPQAREVSPLLVEEID